MTNRTATYLNLHKVPIALAMVCVVLYYIFGYHLERTSFIKLITLYAFLFFLCYRLIQFEKWNYKFLLFCGIIFRLIFLWTVPNLSQDYFRFIWDGQLVLNGINPYLFTPDTLMSQPGFAINNAQELYEGMGSLSARNFSNYPPLNQLVFALCTFLGGKTIFGSVLAMRGIIILSDVGVYYFGRKLLKKFNLPPHLIFWYFLNPLVILELTGNLHFEGVMLFFFIWSMYLLAIKKWAWAGVILAFSISIKLVPLIFLPLFLKFFGLKKSIGFYTIVGLVCTLLLAPFFTTEFISNYTDTIGLWFSNFEFNAGIYNLIKQVGIIFFDAKPWELIKAFGKVTPYLIIASVLLFTFIPKNKKLQTLITSMFWVLTIYYFLSATVHPWYIVFLVLLGLYTKFRFALLWSIVIILSYYAYAQEDFKENLWLILIEYIAVFGFMGYELFNTYRRKANIPKN